MRPLISVMRVPQGARDEDYFGILSVCLVAGGLQITFSCNHAYLYHLVPTISMIHCLVSLHALPCLHHPLLLFLLSISELLLSEVKAVPLQSFRFQN